ncbi:MAG: S41 family peptidase [Muribaculaceae bacterium]|nr:S41 family peptidase [Muribaculaceae bacterium]
MIKKQLFKICLLISVLMIFSSCRDSGDDLIDPSHYPQTETMTGQFEAIWHGINQNYVFWEIDSIDWDEVYTKYHHRFEYLDEQETVKTEDLQKLYEEICGGLIDNHMVIILENLKAGPDEKNTYVVVNPGKLKVEKRDDLQANIPINNFVECYNKLKDDGRIEHGAGFYDGESTGGLESMFTFVVDEDILYLKPASFYVMASLGNPDAYRVYDTYIRQLLFNDNIKNVIIDLRDNGGGMLWDNITILGPLLKEPCHLLDSKTKVGTGRLDYGEWTPFIAEPTTQRQIGKLMEWKDELPDALCMADQKLVVLVNRYSGSMAEITSMGAKNLPYATVIGEQTYGATGPLTDNTHVSFSGEFGDKNLKSATYYVKTSTWLARTVAGTFVEGEGVLPDIKVTLDSEKLTNEHIDNQLEYAIDFLHEK